MRKSITDSSSDRNLLFGILALQMDFVSRDQLLSGMQAWALEKKLPLAEHLVRAKVLSTAQRHLLEPLVDAHVHRPDDPESEPGIMPKVATDQQMCATLDRIGAIVQADAADVVTLPPPVGGFHPTGRYQVLRFHAQGGLGRVQVARDQELNREVALKEIRPEYADDPDRRARFTLEAELTGRLEHPGIVPIYSLGAYPDGSPYYAMQFIRGSSLKDAIEKYHGEAQLAETQAEQNLHLRRLLHRLIAVCETVHYAHSRGVLHRDLKPGNVMLGNYGETLVVDWGLAKPMLQSAVVPPLTTDDADLKPATLPEAPIVHESDRGTTPTLMGSIVGTPAYMSPEQAQGRLDLLGPASDVFSLGAILYELLVGRPPYQGQRVLLKAQNANFEPPHIVSRGVPRPLEAICLKAMAVEPRQRYASAGELEADLERYLADEVPDAYRESFAEKVLRFARRHRAWTQAGAVALTLIACVSSVAFFTVRQSLARSLRAEEFAEGNLKLVQASHLRERLRAEVEMQERKRAEAAEAAARAERDRAERDHRVANLLLAELAPDALDRASEHLNADRESLVDFAVAVSVARRADPTAHERNRNAIATFASLLPRLFHATDAATTDDDFIYERIVTPALQVPQPGSLAAEDKEHLKSLWGAKARLLERDNTFLLVGPPHGDEPGDNAIRTLLAANRAYNRALRFGDDATLQAGYDRTLLKLPAELRESVRDSAMK